MRGIFKFFWLSGDRNGEVGRPPKLRPPNGGSRNAEHERKRSDVYR